MLTAETRIRVKAPLPLPQTATRPALTGDTKIRLSQIVDLKDLALEMAQDEAAPEGAVHHWSDGDHIKKNGKWVPLEKKEIKMAANGKATTQSLTQKFFEEQYDGKVPKTEEEINQFVKDTGATLYDPESSTELNQFTKAGLEQMKEVTGGDFSTVMFVNNPEVIDKDTIAQIVRGMPGVLMINDKNKYWTDPEYQKEVINTYTSTPDKYHPFFHEDAHNELIPTKDTWDPGDRKRAAATSKLAKANPQEFLAEFKAKKKYVDKYPESGIIITEDEIELFKKYGGDYENL